MKVLVAGATGALGAPTVKELVARGHEVYGLTRSVEKASAVTALGARPVFGDVLEAGPMEKVVAEVKPDAVVQLLNAIPKRGPIRVSELDATSRLRIDGTRNLLPAAIRHGAKRYVVESMVFGYGYSVKASAPLDEDAPYGRPAPKEDVNRGIQALKFMEDEVLGATERGEIEGIVLRLGLFYGPGVGSTEFMISLLRKRMFFLPGKATGQLSWIHVADGGRAVADATERAKPGSIYNVVDDEPASFRDQAEELSRQLGLPRAKSIPAVLAKPVTSYGVTMMNTDLRVSNARIKAELGWKPEYPTLREGVASIARVNL